MKAFYFWAFYFIVLLFTMIGLNECSCFTTYTDYKNLFIFLLTYYQIIVFIIYCKNQKCMWLGVVQRMFCSCLAVWDGASGSLCLFQFEQWSRVQEEVELLRQLWQHSRIKQGILYIYSNVFQSQYFQYYSFYSPIYPSPVIRFNMRFSKKLPLHTSSSFFK